MAAQVAQAAGLDMRTWWQPTTGGYLGRVPKALILDAVQFGAGASAARADWGMKKEAMAANAAELLDGTGWLPHLLRIPGATCPVSGNDRGLTALPSRPCRRLPSKAHPMPAGLPFGAAPSLPVRQ